MSIDIQNCIGDSFDGAANMSGQYRGVQARISEVADNHVHVWCYAHPLNLVLVDTTSSTVPSMSLFSLLNSTATFVAPEAEYIWGTRWWAKAGAIQKIFGEFGDTEAANKSLYVDVLRCFFEIASNPQFNVTARDEARTLMDKMRKFETILTAATFNRIFAITTPLIEYLQTSRLDVLQAWQMVESAIEQLEGISVDIPTVLEVATQFAKNANNRLVSFNSDVEVEERLPSKRIRRRKLPFGETDYSNNDTHDVNGNYEVEMYNAVMHQVVINMKRQVDSQIMKNFTKILPF